MWKDTDPRLTIDKRADIIIVRPEPYGDACQATVDTKESWVIFTDFDRYQTMGPNDDWPEGWQWTPTPLKESRRG